MTLPKAVTEAEVKKQNAPNNVPDLHTLDDKALHDFCWLHGWGRGAVHLFPAKPALALEATRQLAHYAQHLIAERKALKARRPEAAQKAQALYRKVYLKIPVWARWK